MSWQDIALESVIENRELGAVLAAVFETNEPAVLIAESIPEKKLDSDIKVMCISRLIGGQFPLMLEIFLRDKRLEDRDPVLAVMAISNLLNCRCLMSDGSINPYQWRLIDHAQIRTVFVDVEGFDEDGALRLVG